MSDSQAKPTFVKIELIDNPQHHGGPIWINLNNIVTIYPTEIIIDSNVTRVWALTVNLGSAVTSYITTILPAPLAELLTS